MRNLDLIIQESIENYINKNLICEGGSSKGGKRKKKDEKGWRKKVIKTKGGQRKDYDVDYDRKYNKNANDVEQSSIETFLKSPFINLKKVAEKLYPDHTPEGAQSQLRKKIEGIEYGPHKKYRLKERDVEKLRPLISKIKK